MVWRERVYSHIRVLEDLYDTNLTFGLADGGRIKA